MTKEKITKRYKAKILKEYCIFQMEVQGLLANSVYQQLIHIEPFVKKHKKIANPSLIKRIKPKDIHRYVIQNTSGFNRKYLKDFLYSLRSFFKFLVFKGYTQYDLINAIPKLPTWQLSNIPRGIPWNDVEKLLKMPNRKTRNGKRNYALLLLTVTYGVRYYQARKLRLKDILWKNKTIHFRSCKGGRPLNFPLYIDIAKALLDYIKNGRPEASFEEVFLQTHPKNIKPLSSRALYSTLKIYYEKAEIRSKTQGFHAIRHSFATRLLNKEVPIKNISDLLGHTSIKSTLCYTKVNETQLRKLAREWRGIKI